MSRLTPEDVACWLIKTSRPPELIAGDWRPETEQVLTRCVRRSYRLDLIATGQPCVLWLSGRVDPGIHATGTVVSPPREDADGWMVDVALTRLADPVPREQLLADPAARGSEVLRMPAGSNPSWLSPAQYAVVLGRLEATGQYCR